MKKSNIRVSEKVTDGLKALKNIGEATTYTEILEDLISERIEKRLVITRDGLLPIGSVVEDEGKPLVVKEIRGTNVFFEDGSFVVNGTKGAYRLKFLASSKEEYDGGVISGER